MSNFWMVRAGEGGYLADEFEQKGYVAVGFEPIQRSFREFHSRQEFHDALAEAAPELKPGGVWVAHRASRGSSVIRSSQVIV